MAGVQTLPIPLLIWFAGLVAVVLLAGHALLVRSLIRLPHWGERQRQRAALLALDDRLLRDVGLTRSAAAREGHRHD